MEGGLSGFVMAVDHIKTGLKGKIPIPELSEAADMKIKNTHGRSAPFIGGMQQGVDAII